MIYKRNRLEKKKKQSQESQAEREPPSLQEYKTKNSKKGNEKKKIASRKKAI